MQTQAKPLRSRFNEDGADVTDAPDRWKQDDIVFIDPLTPGRAACGADVPNKATTQIIQKCR